jgi:hypothetical protein
LDFAITGLFFLLALTRKRSEQGMECESHWDKSFWFHSFFFVEDRGRVPIWSFRCKSKMYERTKRYVWIVSICLYTVLFAETMFHPFSHATFEIGFAEK